MDGVNVSGLDGTNVSGMDGTKASGLGGIKTSRLQSSFSNKPDQDWESSVRKRTAVSKFCIESQSFDNLLYISTFVYPNANLRNPCALKGETKGDLKNIGINEGADKMKVLTNDFNKAMELFNASSKKNPEDWINAIQAQREILKRNACAAIDRMASFATVIIQKIPAGEQIAAAVFWGTVSDAVLASVSEILKVIEEIARAVITVNGVTSVYEPIQKEWKGASDIVKKTNEWINSL